MDATYYKGIVKNNVDKTGNGRIQVYIPAFGGKPDDSLSWYVVSYVSPYLGSTNPYLNEAGGQQENQSQDSYGIFQSGFHLEQEVVISFMDGDRSKGVVLGSLFGQNMVNSIAGYPSGKSTEGKIGGVNPPTVEYNKRDTDIDPQNPLFPLRKLLSEQLWKQGLFKDFLRGQIDTSPLRDLVPQFMSFKTPSGNVFTIDDGKIASSGGAGIDERRYDTGQASKPYVRMRSASGAQFLMNSNCGFVYMNSKDGNSWAQIGNHGIQFFTGGNLMARTQGNFSQKSDANFNIEVGGDAVIMVHGGMYIETDAGFNLKAANITEQSETNHNTLSDGDMTFESSGDHSETAASNIMENSSMNNENAVAGNNAEDIDAMSTSPSIDRQENGSQMSADSPAEGPSDKKSNDTTIPEGQMVTHEPYAYQPYACGGADSYAEEAEPSGEATQEQPLSDGTTDEVPTEPNVNPSGAQGSGSPLGDKFRKTSDFDLNRLNPVSGVVRPHYGMDMAGPQRGMTGMPVSSTADGTVQYAGWKSGYGNIVEVKHANGYVTRYAHLDSMNVTAGQTIHRGTVVGGMGTTGGSTGVHLHYEILKNGKFVNPAPYVNGTRGFD